ncbi:MAG: protein kinase [Pirellulales bacterium]
MPNIHNCPFCQAELDPSSLAQGRCAGCGKLLTESSQDTEEQATLELPSGAVTQLESDFDLNQGTIEQGFIGTGSLNTPADEQSQDGPQTVLQGSDQTLEFSPPAGVEEPVPGSDSSSQSDELSLAQFTTQWEDGGEGHLGNDSQATIKQNETIAETGSSSSSLIVKSRHVHSTMSVGPAAKSDTVASEAPDYELLDVIGEGGMGVVYAAKQSSIARTVAVKMLKGDDAPTLEQRDKFISEAVVTGELEHPNIVPVYDLGSNDDGALFYSMKRVRGTPWNKVIKKKLLDENLNILLRMSDAIAFAHANGVVHRDLKPENVMLGDYGEVLVMDWGLARISPDFPNASSVSQSDVMGGTPAYMAPEMATGPIERITAASDIYLLGAILFEFITGRPPHSGKTVMACLFAASKNKIAATEHSGELIAIALRAMATEPAERFHSVCDFQEAIRRYQAHSESIVLAENSAKYLESANDQDDYDLFARSVYGLQEALAMWEDNQHAAGVLVQASGDYAGCALRKGDLDLGISLLESSTQPDIEQSTAIISQPSLRHEEHRPLYEQLLAARYERKSRQRRLRLLKGLVAVLICAVAGIVTVSYVAVHNQRNEARVQRDRAVDAENEATQNYQVAEAARQVAETEKQRAQKERERAETQRSLAVAAKQAEAYEAYVARIGLAKAKIDENSFARARELLEQCPQALRQWEWGRLRHLSRLSRHSWQLEGPVETVAFSPDGTHFASGDWDGKARLWNIETTKCEQTISHGQYVHAVAFDSAGTRLATGSSDHTIRIYQARNAKLLTTLTGHTDAVLSVRFSPDGRQLLSSGYDNTARLWNLGTGACQQVLQGHGWWVWSAEFSPSAEQIVTASQDGKAIVWQRQAESGKRKAESGKQEPQSHLYEIQTEFSQHRGPVYTARFSPDGEQVATGGYDQRVFLWNPQEVVSVDVGRRLQGLPDRETPYQQFIGHAGPVRTLAFSPDGLSLASGGQDNRLCVWDLATGSLRNTLRGHASHIRSCDYSPQGRWLLSGGRDAQIKLWEPKTYAPSLVFGEEDADAVLDARFSRDGRQVVTASRDRTAAVWEVATGQLQQRLEEGHEYLASTGCFYADGSRVATGAGDGSVRIWNVATGGEIFKLESTGRAAALDVDTGGRWVATGGPADQTLVWDARFGHQLAKLEGDGRPITAVRFAPGGHLLATGDARGRCQLWKFHPTVSESQKDEQETEKQEAGVEVLAGEWVKSHQLLGHSRTITALAFGDDPSAEGELRLITASGDNTCGQWDVESGQELRTHVLRHPDWVTDLKVTADGAQALTSCEDGRLRLWSLTTGKLLQSYESPEEGLVWTSVDLSASGTWALAVSAARRTIYLWELETAESVEVNLDASQVDRVALAKPWLDFSRWGGLVWSARFAPNGQQVLTLGGNDARLWDRAAHAPQVRFSPHGVVASVDMSPDGKRLATGSWDQSAKVWDLATGQVMFKLDRLHKGYVNSVQFSPEGSRVLTASDDGTARLWDVANGNPLEPIFEVPGVRLLQACFRSDALRLLTVSSDKLARIWNVETGVEEVRLTGHEWAVLCGQFSRDGRQVLTGSEDNRAIIWDAMTGKPVHTLSGHTGSVTAVAFAPDGHRVLTGSEDSTVKLWDAQTGKELLTLTGLREGVTAVGFSPDGKQALGSGRNGQTILWPAVAW